MTRSEDELQFEVTNNGVFCDGIKISEYVKIVGLVETLAEKSWKTRLEFNDMNGKKCLIDIDNEKFLNIGDLIKELIHKGMCPDIDSKALKKYLSESFSARTTINRYIEVNKTGWIDEKSYLCPSFSVCDAKSNFIIQNVDDAGYSISGTHEEWKEKIADLCQNNSLLTFSLCVALAPILLRYFPEINTTIFHLVGRSSIGKTTALKVAASVWGEPKRYIKQWRATGNAQEGIAESHNDSLLLLDEIGQANDKDIQQTVYMLGNEKGKARMTADAALRKSKSWRLFCLSSGEVGISEKIEAAGERVHGGVLVRCIDIEAQASKGLGIFEDLRGYKNGNEFSTLLAERTAKYHGTAAKLFIEKISQKDQPTILDIFDKALERMKHTLKLENVQDGAMSRVLNSFALINTAGILACNDCFGVLPHNCMAIDEDIYNIAKRCLTNVYNQEDEETEIVEYVLQFLKQNEARFRPICRNGLNQGFMYQYSDSRNIKWLGGIESNEGRRIYYIFPTAFKDEICKGQDVKMCRKILQKRGIMRTYNDDTDIRYTLNRDRIRMVTLCFET